MTARERSTLGDRVARKRLNLAKPPARTRTVSQRVASRTCRVHKVAVPVKADGTLDGYCFKCLGEAATALERWGYEWRLNGYVAA